MRSRKMRWEGHVARIGGDRKSYKVLVEKPEGDLLEDRDIAGRIGSE
jgi:hypothetical protein